MPSEDVFYAGSMTPEPEAVEYSLTWHESDDHWIPHWCCGFHTRTMESGEKWLGPMSGNDHGIWFCSLECAKSVMTNFRAIPMSPETPYRHPLSDHSIHDFVVTESTESVGGFFRRMFNSDRLAKLPLVAEMPEGLPFSFIRTSRDAPPDVAIAPTPFTITTDYTKYEFSLVELLRSTYAEKRRPVWAWTQVGRPGGIGVALSFEDCLKDAYRGAVRTSPIRIHRVIGVNLEESDFDWDGRGKLVPQAASGRPLSRFHLPKDQRR